MNPYLSRLNRIEFLITMACTGRCKHCSEGEHVSNGVHINGHVATKAIYDICKIYNIKSLMTFGGEPLLYPEDVCMIHTAAKKMNVPDRSIITNGFFCKDTTRIKEVAHMLAESGVNCILLSVDTFHQETIPIHYVQEFAQAILDEKIPIKAHPAWLVSPKDKNPYNLQTLRILKEFETLGIDVSKGNIIFPAGNAKKYLGEYFDDKEQYVNPYEENPADVRTICFSPNGNVLNGNVYKKSVLDILNTYIPNA